MRVENATIEGLLSGEWKMDVQVQVHEKGTAPYVGISFVRDADELTGELSISGACYRFHDHYTIVVDEIYVSNMKWESASNKKFYTIKEKDFNGHAKKCVYLSGMKIAECVEAWITEQQPHYKDNKKKFESDLREFLEEIPVRIREQVQGSGKGDEIWITRRFEI